MATTTRTTAKDTTACAGCGVPGCDNPADPAAFGVCLEHRAEELGAERNQVFGRTYDDLIHEWRTVELDKLEHMRKIAAEARRKREQQWWRDTSYRRGRAVLMLIVKKFGEEVAQGRGRNEALTAAAWATGRLVAGREIEGGDAWAELTIAAKEVGLKPGEARGVIRRQFAKARQQPRVLAERRAA